MVHVDSASRPLSHPIRWVVVGAGHIGRRHAEHIARHADTQLVGMVDLLPREECAAREYPEIPFYRSVEELIEYGGDTFDMASICVPNGLHFDLSRRLLQAGKSLLIEKPVVLYPEQAAELQQIASDRGAQIYSVLQNRFTPVSRWLHDLVSSGSLGQIYRLDMQCLWNRDDRYYLPRRWHGDKELDGGTLFTQYSHFVDLLIWIFGMPRVDHTSFANYQHHETIDFEDSGSVQLTFPGEVQCHLSYSTAVYGTNCGVRLSILAERGCVVLDGPFMNQLTHCVVEGVAPPSLESSSPANGYGAYSGSAQNHHFVIDHTARALLGDASAQAVGLQDALRVVQLIRRIYRTNPYL